MNIVDLYSKKPSKKLIKFVKKLKHFDNEIEYQIKIVAYGSIFDKIFCEKKKTFDYGYSIRFFCKRFNSEINVVCKCDLQKQLDRKIFYKGGMIYEKRT